MLNTMMMERSAVGGSIPSGMGAPSLATTPTTANWCVVPQCKIEIEKCADGCQIWCRCDDETACATLQNLCRMLAGGQCSICCQLNGIVLLDCKLTCGFCKCEFTEDGCCITCCSGDAACCEMIQTCCEAIACCITNGCACYVCFNNAPICCCR